MADPTRDLLTGLEAIDKKIEQINADARSASTELQAIQNSGNIDATATTRMAELKRIIDNGLNEINQLTERRMQEIEAEATHVHRKPLQTFPLAGANPNSYPTNQSSPGFSSSFFARAVRAFEIAF